MSSIFLVVTPIATAIALLIWLSLGKQSPILGIFSNFTSAIIGMIVIFIFDKPENLVINKSIIGYIILFSVINAVATLSWIYSLKGYSAPVTAFVEISYPLFMLVISYVIWRNVDMSFLQLIGGLITIIGTTMLVLG